MGVTEETRKRIDKLNVPYDMKKMAWDWYIFGYKDGRDEVRDNGE